MRNAVDHKSENSIYKDSTILVTGGTGSIGLELVNTLLRHDPREIRILSNDENGLFEASNLLGSDSRVSYRLADVRNQRGLESAISDCDIVFHAAALKHVRFCEGNPYEAISTNILGTQNLIELSLDAGVRRFVFVSTDKAVNPVSTMGATKLLGEKLVISASKTTTNAIFSIVRFGNVLGSRGSVMMIFQNEVEQGESITVTDPNMTRFFMLPSDASRLVLRASELAKPGEIFILKMKTVKIGDLAEMSRRFFCRMYKKDLESITIRIIGPQPGEKMHEELMTRDEAANAIDLKDYYIANPDSRRKLHGSHLSISESLVSNLFTPVKAGEIIDSLSRLYKLTG